MAVTKTSFEWTASSSLTQTVPFEVIAAGDIDVYVEGVLQLQQNTTSTADATHPQVVSGEITQGTALTNYTVASNNGSITFNANLTVDDFVVIERTTDDTLLETFTSGSTVRARDLNSAFERVLFIAQEGVNIANEALAPSDDEDDALDAKGERISNVADATDDDDAVNRAQLGKVITDDLVAGEGIDLTDVSGGTNSGQQVTVSAELSTAVNPGVVRVNATTPITATYTNPGQLDLSIENNSIDIGKIQTDDIINLAEQNAGSPNPSDTKLFTSSAAAKRFDTLVQTNTPSGSDYQVGKTWLQNDDELTLSIWNGSAWTGIASGGTFTNQPKVVYVDASSGDDNNDGHRISRPKLTIKAAVNQINNDADFGDGSVVIVAPGVYQEALPIQIEKKNVSIIGNALRSCIVHPTVATQESTMFELNSGSYIANLTLTGMKASGSLGNSVDAVLPTSQGWNFAFFSNAVITKSPYIQNCTNFSDSEIDNSDLNANTPAGGLAGDTDSAPTGGGLLVDGSVPATASPLRSIVCDSYTHVGLNGPGILVTNNGYVQATSSYAFFNRYHIKCLNGGQANLAASTTDFGDQALVADGKSTTAIFTADTTANAAENDITFTVGAQTAGSGWFGDTTRPGSNMLVELGGTIYPILSAVANGSGWDVTISRPDPNNRSTNLGLDGAVTSGSTAEFFLRSMIASSGHTMEYVGSGTDYRALPENGGVPDETKQITELNDGKVWTAITDHNGKFKIGGNQTDDPIFEVNQQLGFITIPTGSIAFNLLSDTTPQLGGDLNVNGNEITSASNGDVTINPNGTGDIVLDANVGIGTTSPNNELHVSGSGAFSGTASSLSNDQVQIGFTAPEGFIKAKNSSGSPAANLGLYTTNASGTTSKIVHVSFDGNVGIGTSSPSNFDSEANNLVVGDGTGDNGITIFTGSTVGSFGSIFFADSSSGGAAKKGQIRYEQNNEVMSFHTNESERLRIDLNGNVGIGTSSPGAKLDVNGEVVFSTNTAGKNTHTFTTNASNDGRYLIKSDTTTKVDIQANGSSFFNGGNVGIGTTIAAKPLQVHNTSQSAVLITNTNPAVILSSIEADNNDANRSVFGQATSTDAYITNAAVGDTVLRSTNSSNLLFGIGTSEKLRIDSSGNVGIGTTSITEKLTVFSNNDTSAVDNGLAVYRSAGDDKVNINCQGGAARFISDGGSSYIPTRFGRYNGTTLVNDITIDSSGNFGIGTTSPDKLLHLAGADTAIIRLENTDTSLTADQIIGGLEFEKTDGSGAGAGVVGGLRMHSEGAVGESAYLTLSTASSSTNDAERLRINSTGLHTITASNNSTAVQIRDASNYAGQLVTATDGTFQINARTTTTFTRTGSNTESMRIDSSGRLLIGTSTSQAHAGANLVEIGNYTLTNAGITINSPTSGAGMINFGDSASSNRRGRIEYNHTADAFRLYTADSERMRIDSSGNLLVGTASNARGKLTVFNGDDFNTGTLNNGDNIYLMSDATSGNNVYGASIAFSRTQYQDRKAAAIAAVQTSSDAFHVGLAFFTHSSSSADDPIVESMRLDGSGRLLINTTSSFNTDGLLQAEDSGNTAIALRSTSLADNGHVNFTASGQSSGGNGYRLAEVGLFKNAGNTNPGGYIRCDEPGGDQAYLWVDNNALFRISNSLSHVGTTSNGTVVGSQSSDERVKNVGEAVAYGLSEIKQLQPKQFEYKKDLGVNKIGFIAQEVESVIPEAVFDTGNELDGHQEGDRTKLGMEYVAIIPVLVNAVKELSAEVDTLKAKVAALEAAE